MASNDLLTEFEEDVILPNSPLAQYLNELDTNEKTCLFQEEPATENVQEKTSLSHECPKPIQKDVSFPLKRFFLREIEHWKNCLSTCFLRSNLEEGNAHLNTFLATTIKKCLLIPEDRNFIKNLSSETSNLEVPQTFSAKPLLTFVFVLTAFCLITYISNILDNSLIVVFITLLFVLFSMATLSFYLYCIYSGTEYRLCCQSLQTFPSSTKIALMLIKDCSIRLIQEAELIARGFTSASVLGVAERIELSFELPISSPSRQYSELRKIIFSWLRGTFIDYRTLTLDLMQNIPVEEVYSSPSCLATLDISEFGGFLNHELSSPEILEVTDNFSIRSLKTMHHLTEMQVSEFFKKLAIRLYVMKDQDPIDYWKKIGIIRWLASRTQPLDKKMVLMFQEVYKTYKYYKSIEASYVDDKEIRCSHDSKSPKSNLKVTVHNMCLHLKAALLRLIEIEDNLDAKSELEQFESKATLDQFDSITEVDQLDAKAELEQFKNHVPNLLPLLSIAKSEVVAFDECCTKFSKIVEDLLYPEKQNSLDNLLPDEIIPKNMTDLEAPIERCDVDREIHDEVFEAVVSNTCDDKQQSGAAFIGEEARKNTELATFLLKELKNVLVNKADEHRIREEVALAKKMDQVCLNNQLDDNKNDQPSQFTKSEIKIPLIENSFTECDVQSENPKNESSPVETDEEYDIQCDNPENESSPVKTDEKCDISVLPDNNSCAGFMNLSNTKMDSFAASIATLAAQRQKLLGLSSEEFVDGSDSSDSGSES